MALLWLLLAFALVAAAAARYGADSRDGRDWQRLTGRVWPERLPARRYTPTSDLRAMRRVVLGRRACDVVGPEGYPPRHPYGEPPNLAARYLDPPPTDPRWAPPNGRSDR